MHIYHREYAGRPIRIAWTLEELGVPYGMTTLSREESKNAEHLARHPLGKVPVLEVEGEHVFESAAICLHLADLHPRGGLAPEPGTPARAQLYQWCVYSPAELEPPLIEAAVYAQSDPERGAAARSRFEAAVLPIADALGEGEFLVGESFTVADVLVGSTLGWTVRAGFPEAIPASLQDYVERLTGRAAYKRALERTSA